MLFEKSGPSRKTTAGILDRLRSKTNRPPLRVPMARSVLEQIRRTIGSMPAEEGGALGGNRETGVVTHFYFDKSARRTGSTYSPNDKLLNKLFAEKWNPVGINLLGFVHSHPEGCHRPSGGDLAYARKILKYIPELEQLLLPIVMTEPETGTFELFAYAAVREGNRVRLQPADLVLVDDGVASEGPGVADADEDVAGTAARPRDLKETFRRVVDAYDLERLAGCRVVYVGVGGAASFIEDMARAGVGEHVLIDPDVVSETNLATQQVYRRDLGRPKVECVAERIQDINPNALVVTCQRRLDAIDDAEFKRLAIGPRGGKRPLATLVCGLTDNFEAQARVNRLALQFGLPSLCAQVYREGRGAEITLTYPGVTPACHRCALSSRYKAYLADGFKNTVTSDGTPIFATTRLNALKGFVAMAILHHGSQHKRLGTLLERIGDRNLILIRMDPDLASTLRLTVFDQVFGGGDEQRILFDDVVWLPQRQDCPEHGFPTCPDCGGTGDLRAAAGTFGDTRTMRK
jgi:proteasome lid subunit RPN8/RPN11